MRNSIEASEITHASQLPETGLVLAVEAGMFRRNLKTSDMKLTVKDGGQFTHVIVDEEGDAVAIMCRPHKDKARLLAAAPRMAKAIDGLIELLAAKGQIDSETGKAYAEFAEAREALHDATGVWRY